MILIGKQDKTAVVHRGRQFSYVQLLQYSACYARHFAAAVGQPRMAIVFADNSAEWIFAFYGSVRTGAITVPVDVQSTAGELAYIVGDCKPDLIFTTTAKRALVDEALSMAGVACSVLTEEDIDVSGVASEAVDEIVFDDMSQTMLIIYTSGTTGSPKGVMLSYNNVMFNINSVSQSVKIFTSERNTMILLPLHHIFPLLGSLVAPLYVGETVYIAEGLNAESIVKTLNEGKINIVIGVPRLYELLSKGIMDIIKRSFVTRALFGLAKAIGSKGFSCMLFGKVHKKFGGHIDYLVSGGAALPPDIGSIFKTLGFTVLEGYGMTETAPMITFTRPWNVQVGYAGEPVPGVEVRIAENGEVCVKGDNVMQGYYNRPQETADIIRDGWLHTGDTGELSPTKGLKLTGRIKEIIVTPNGKNINPEELEHAVLQHTNLIKEIGIFLKDSALQCVVVPELSELRDKSVENMETILREEIAKFNQTVATYKRIKNIHIVSGELPKTRLMKLQRFKLPELATTHKRTTDESDAPQSEIYLMLKAYIDKELKCNAGANDDFEIDLAMDSLGKVALLTFIETSFGISMNEAQLDNLSTLAKLSAYIEQNEQDITAGANVTWKEILTSKVRRVVVPRAGFIQAFCSRSVKVMMHTFYNLKKHGGVELSEQPCIIVANHRSMLDGYFITSKLQSKFVKNTFFFAKAKHLRTKFLTFMARKNNVIVMDINKNVRESLQQMAMVLQEGKNIIIFPEGTRSKDGKLLAFKDSFAILSTELNVPVVPVAIAGADRAVFKTVKLPRPFAKISVDFLPTIYPAGLSVNEIRQRVVEVISAQLAKYEKHS
ncbi:MAG: AMP-binding protein [Paludibacteraceae bacterium]